MKNRATQFSPQAYARAGGALYLIIIGAGLFAEAFVRGRLIVSADAAATATNINMHELMFRIGIAADLSTFLCAVVLAVILYVLLVPVSRHLALLMLIFNLVQDAIGGLNALNTYKALQLLGGADYLKVFNPEQLQAMALLSLKGHSVGFGLALIFFGLSCLILGYLIFKSGFLPRALGVLIAIAGACYLLNSFALVLSPPLASALFPTILLPAFVGELSLALWLAVRGVDLPKWENMASTAQIGRA